jgi:hypothetical protein
MRIRRRNWIIKRIALGFAVSALVAPAAAQARVDEGGNGQPNSVSELVVKSAGTYVPFVTDFPKYESAGNVKSGDYGMPRAMPNDYAIQRGDLIEVVRTQPRSTVSADIENVRLNPRGSSGSVVEASPTFNWGDAGIGAGLVIALLLAGGAAFYGTRHLGRAQTA